MPLCTNNIYFEGGGGAGGGLGSGRWIGGQSFRSVDGVGTFTLVPDDVVLRILASAKERVSFSTVNRSCFLGGYRFSVKKEERDRETGRK